MRTLLVSLGIALASLTVAPTAALAKPAVTVSVGLPRVVVAPAPRQVVVYRPKCPGPNFYWVEGTWRRDYYGRPIFVNGYWAKRQVVVQRTPGRTVIVKKY